MTLSELTQVTAILTCLYQTTEALESPQMYQQVSLDLNKTIHFVMIDRKKISPYPGFS